MTVLAADLVRALDRVLPAVSREREHPALQCVLVDAGEGALRLVATDRHRLVVSEVRASGGGASSFNALVRPDDLSCVRSAPADATVTLALHGDALRLDVGDDVHDLPIAPDEFPDYARFLGADPAGQTVVVDRSALLSAIEAADDEQPLAVRLTDGAIEIGEPPIPVATAYTGADITLMANAVYLHDAVSAVDGYEVVVDVVSPMHPIVVRDAGDGGCTTLVMPVRVAGAAKPRRRSS